MKICITCKKEKKDKDFKKKCDICSNCRKKCEHGTRKTRCIKCKGSSICEHNKVKYRCIKCLIVSTFKYIGIILTLVFIFFFILH